SPPSRPSPSRSSAPRWRPMTGVGKVIPREEFEPPPPPMMDEPYPAPSAGSRPVFGRSVESPDAIDAAALGGRAGDGAFFASSTARAGEGDAPSAAVLPRGIDRPVPSSEPLTRQTLPPVNWVASNPNPSTYENQRSRRESEETGEFGLHVPR